MRELFIEELQSVVGGGAAAEDNDFFHTTRACCEEGPFDGCCWYGEVIQDLIRP